MSEIFEFADQNTEGAVIKVIGVGGGGSNTVNQMVSTGIEGVEFVCANTDRQHLEQCAAEAILPLGESITRGLGAGADPEVGRRAAQEDRESIIESIRGSDMLFITAGMGGGTGTGAAPVVAEIAKELGILTIAVVTKPFQFERARRMEIANAGIAELKEHVDSLIVIPNERLLSVLGKGTSLNAAFKAANDVLQDSVQGIADLLTRPGHINVDFADVRRAMSARGMSMIGMGAACGECRAQEAAEAALASPLLEDLNLTGAEGVLVNITAADADSIDINEFSLVNELVSEVAADNADIIVGTAFDPMLDDELRVTVVATGLGKTAEMAQPESSPKLTRKDSGEVDYEVLDKPTIIRNNSRGRHQSVDTTEAVDMDYLDVPAFLRQQMD